MVNIQYSFKFKKERSSKMKKGRTVIKVEDAPLTGYKGFDKDLSCWGYQYKEGEKYEHKGEIALCKSGFHFCMEPADTMNYYPITNSKYGMVIANEVSDEVSTKDSKRVARKIQIVKVYSNLEWAKLLIDHYKICPKNKRVIVVSREEDRGIDLTKHTSIKANKKVIIIEKYYYGKVSIIGKRNVIITSDNSYHVLEDLVIVGEKNNIINLGRETTITIVGKDNNILNLAKKEGKRIEIRVDGDFNVVANEGDPIIATLIGDFNRYRGIEGDKIIFVYPMQNEEEPPKIKTRKLMIGKRDRSHWKFHTTFS